jgi:hypothetical protein
MPTAFQPEFVRQQQSTLKVLALLRERKGLWIPWALFAEFAPCAWRSRISDARQLAKADKELVQWNRNPRQSMYRLIDAPLGRDAAIPAPETQPRTLFEMWKRA